MPQWFNATEDPPALRPRQPARRGRREAYVTPCMALEDLWI
jgi:hypothetical protein